MFVDWKSHERLLAALILAGILHALIILGLSFELPKSKPLDKSLDVVLVVNPTPKPPQRAEFLAPETQKGAGEALKKAIPRAIPNLVPVDKAKKIVPTLAPPTPRPSVDRNPTHHPEPVAEDHSELQTNQPVEPKREERPKPEEKPLPQEKPKPVAEENPALEESLVPFPEVTTKPVMTQANSEKKITASTGMKGSTDYAAEPRHLSAEMLSQQIAEVTTEFNKSLENQAKQQRMVYINSVNAHKYKAAAYEADWQEKVERIGNLNYPDEARRQNLTGSLLMAVGIKADGSIYSIKIRQSSGEPVLDEAAERIVRMAAPFSLFPPELLEEADVLVITRTWRFTVGNRIDTGE